jgi:L-lysine 6-transaminase
MSTVTATSPRVAPSEVHEVLARHMLADGFKVVLDLERSHGSWLFDSKRGHEMLDMFTSFSSYPMGYNHPKLMTPEMRERLLLPSVVKPSNADLYTPQLADFVATFARTVPAEFRRHLFFVDGGALAVENALKTAFDWKVRKNLAAGKGEKGQQIIHFRQAFHGRSGYTMSLTNTDLKKTQYFPKFPWPRISNPKLSFPITDEVLAAVQVAEERAVAEIHQALRDNPDDVAAIIIEPIQAEGGDNHFRPEFLRRLRQIADETELLLIFDEVQTGFATTGRWWAFEHFGVQPDVFAFGKKTQQCGIAVTARIDDVDSVFKVSSRINSTWGGNLVDMVRCQRFVEIIEEDGLLDNAATMGRHLLAGLQQLAASFPGKVDNARGLGLLAAFDLPSGELRDRALRSLNEQDLLALPCGERSLRFRPALVISREEIDEAVRRAERALARVF